MLTTSNATFYIFDDRVVNYSVVQMLTESLTPPGWEEGGEPDPEPPPFPPAYDYGAGELWIEILSVENDYDRATLGLHNVAQYSYGQILSRTNIEDQAWKFGRILPNYDGTNFMVFDPLQLYGLAHQFYRGVQGFPVVSIEADRYFAEATEPAGPSDPPGGIGIFNINLSDTLSTNLTVQYQIGGTALNGVDYTNLSGMVTFPSGIGAAQIFVHPYYDNILEFAEPVTLTLMLTNGYVVDPDRYTATVWIKDNISTNLFQTVVTNLFNPIGIDYHAPSNSLLVSLNYAEGTPHNFIRVYPDGANPALTNSWSGIATELDEVKLATVKQTAAGFTNGDVYFGSDTKIGWLSSDATRSNLTWCVLTNDVVTNALHLRGSLYADQTGSFSNQLIAVTSGDDYNLEYPKGVWRVSFAGQPTLLANITTYHLEGAITLTNDVAKWGPWAGKVLTGDEYTHKLYAVDTNGAVATFELGIDPEDFDLIPPNQDLYCVNLHLNESSSVLKLPRQVLANYVGDLLITDAGEYGSDPAVNIVSWNGSNFEVRRIVLPSSFGGHFEHVTFAPLDLPPVEP